MPIMSEEKEEAPNSGEPVCMLCRRAEVDPDICGRTFAVSGFCAHHFCLFFANGLLEQRLPRGGIFGFPLDAVQSTIQLADQKNCFVCGGRGAAISCAETGCERSFHLPCAEDGECVTQYFGPHRSFCWEHRPRQAAEAAPSPDTVCVICLEPVGDSTSYHTMVCPVCKQAWFHRGCVRKQAMHAAILRFFCPVCSEKATFRSEMTIMGIQTPIRRPTWWDDKTYPSLRQRHRRCDASECLYQEGREEAEEEGPWQLLLCSSCAAEGTHRQCSSLASSTSTWECDTCAGVGTASHTDSEHARPSTFSQEAAGPPHTVSGPENISSGPTSQAALGLSRSSQLPERSVQPREPAAEQRTTRPGLRGRRRAPAAGAESCSRSPTRRGTRVFSRGSQAAARRKRPTQRGRGCTRSRSPLQSRASGSQSRPRRRHGGSRTTPRGAQSSTRTSARPAPSRSSRASPLPARRRRSGQRGRAHTRSRSPVGRRASYSRSRPRGGRGSRSRQRGPAQARSRSRVQHRSRRPRSRSQRRRRSSRAPSPRDGFGPRRTRK
ncbi:PHD finger protein 7-like isoform X2 [Numida meleagris]|uniref:PHD finger protein 7-like isoform X2 n=1 Tax=Numida meleagris TaxID=8996 RepID=UPI000B3DB351|nr:PHD finger protein 7-like isoform X2 [Numida meleagris]